MKKTKFLKVTVFIFAFAIGICSVFAADKLTYTVSIESGAHAIKQGKCSGGCSGFSGSLDFFCLQGVAVTQGIVGATATEILPISEDNFIVAKVLKDLGIDESTGLIANSNYSLYSQAENALYRRTTSDVSKKWFNTYEAYKDGFNPSITNLLTFSLKGDNYEATATVSDLGSYADLSCTTNKGTVNVSNDKSTVSVSVPKASITSDETVTVTCTAGYEYYMSQIFDGQQNSQDLAIKPKKYSNSKPLNTSGKINVEKSKVTISKTDATGQKELPGAKLSILDKDGKVLNKCIFDKTNHKITYSDTNATACTWVSEDTSYIFEGLPVGKYYLVEEIAPKGYDKSSEKIEIEITDAGAVKDKVVMKNAPTKVPVPNTLSGSSALSISIAILSIAAGIAILIYFNKKNVEE